MCYWNRKCCTKLRFDALLGSWERWTVVVFLFWPQFGGRTRWCSSLDSWARALAKWAVTNEFSSVRLARRIITGKCGSRGMIPLDILGKKMTCLISVFRIGHYSMVNRLWAIQALSIWTDHAPIVHKMSKVTLCTFRRKKSYSVLN